jgi:hypothetical protein
MRTTKKILLQILGIPLALYYISQMKHKEREAQKKTQPSDSSSDNTFRENMQRFERFEERMKEHYRNLKTRIGQFFYPSK